MLGQAWTGWDELQFPGKAAPAQGRKRNLGREKSCSKATSQQFPRSQKNQDKPSFGKRSCQESLRLLCHVGGTRNESAGKTKPGLGYITGNCVTTNREPIPRDSLCPRAPQQREKLGKSWRQPQDGGQEQHKHPLCPNPGRAWEEGEEKLGKVSLPFQQQLHSLGTAVHGWEKTGKTRENMDHLCFRGIVSLQQDLLRFLILL